MSTGDHHLAVRLRVDTSPAAAAAPAALASPLASPSTLVKRSRASADAAVAGAERGLVRAAEGFT